MQIGKVYHQEFSNGERAYVKVLRQFKNGRFQGLTTEGRKKPVQCSIEPSLPFWIETPENEIPKSLA